jgi:hypothetical protein
MARGAHSACTPAWAALQSEGRGLLLSILTPALQKQDNRAPFQPSIAHVHSLHAWAGGVQVYTDAAAQDGVSLTEAPHGTREFMLTELPGNYRPVIHYPTQLQVAPGRIQLAGLWHRAG